MYPLAKNCVNLIGNPDAGQSLVFVNGFGTEQGVWQGVCAPFLETYRIILFDNAGSGRSDASAFAQHRYLNLSGYVQDLLDIGQALNLQNAILVGHSVGAMIGVLASLQAPDLFSKLVLIGASPRYLDDTNYRGGFSEADLNELYRLVSLHFSSWADDFAASVMARPDQPDLAHHFANTIKTIPPERALTVLCSIFQSDHRHEVAQLRKPTLIIQARDDIAVPIEVAQYLHRVIPGSELKLIDASGHLPHFSAPHAVIDAMTPFLSG